MKTYLAAWSYVLFLFATFGPAQAATRCAGNKVDVGGYGLWAKLEGTGPVTFAFEAGGGDDSTVWTDVAAKIRALGYATLVYDRSGLGRSDLRPGPYSNARDVHDFRAVLTACGLKGAVYIVSHSYGGFISGTAASRDQRIKGLILVDANLPGYFTPQRTAALLAQYRPQYSVLREKAPKLAAVMIPMMEAYPRTVTAVRRAGIPANMPVIDIVAENSWATNEADAQAMRAAHVEFVRLGSNRSSVFAKGSSHRIMRDSPGLIVDAAKRMAGG